MLILKIVGFALLWIVGMYLHDYTRRHGKP